MANNALEIIPAEIGLLTHLRTVDLHGNMIHTLGKEGGFSRLLSMHTLDLSNNRLESLPDDFGKLCSLIDLNLSHNRLRWLPESIGELPEIKAIDKEVQRDRYKLTNLSKYDSKL